MGIWRLFFILRDWLEVLQTRMGLKLKYLSEQTPLQMRWKLESTPNLLLTEEIRLTNWYGEYPIIYRVLYIPGSFLAGFLKQINSRMPLAAMKGRSKW